jgi:CDP-glycerol glycerophosphotransferase (TagB/SpsB family)
MVYRKGAFDKYDTIFCAGPHHIKEVRAIEKKYNLPPKKLVEHGYGRIDSIIDSIEKSTEKTTNDPPKILIAPSWGENALIESVGEKVVLHLLETGFHVTLRPHPRTVKFSKDKLNSISQQHKHNPNFSYEINIASQKSLHQSDLMISDWSGAALDYAFGLGKPVLFIDVPRKINNQEYESINIDPFEVWIREKVGRVQRLEDLENLNRLVYDLLSSKTCFNQKSLAEKNIFNLGNSSRFGAAYLMQII